MRKMKIKLGARDAAVILRNNGTYETVCPYQEDDEVPLASTRAATKLAYCLSHPQDAKLIEEMFVDYMNSIKKEDAGE